ncbi:MAG: hypothetical protein QOC81_3476 [Thermoanaerobaculia bacterium]|nr:hypothetical protein [Thermoanaerobaculia bacterium]
MSATVWSDESDFSVAADAALKTAARFWFVVFVASQLIFVAYVIAFYGGAAIRGNLQAWNQVIPQGYTPGNSMSNAAVAMHLLVAAVIMAGGPLQLIPQMRHLAPRLHRWNGRLYAVSLFVISATGLQMIWSRPHAGVAQYVGTALHAALIMTFAVLTVRYAIARDLKTHRRWALRLFMVVNAGLFFRIGLLQWIFLYKGPIGFDPKTFAGPFVSLWSIADYVLPLVILEIYLYTRARGGISSRFATAAALIALTIAMGIGISTAATVLWAPRVRAVNASTAHNHQLNQQGAVK